MKRSFTGFAEASRLRMQTVSTPITGVREFYNYQWLHGTLCGDSPYERLRDRVDLLTKLTFSDKLQLSTLFAALQGVSKCRECFQIALCCAAD
jgi:hypothetical protein